MISPPCDLEEMGLTEEDYRSIVSCLGRAPTSVELGVFSAMWSEHCSYGSSRFHLQRLPTEGPCVLQGPGENAGAVDIGDGQIAVFKIESHNHPSFLEPYQGAATGVGGIIRDVLTMGARPLANLNVLCFGDPQAPRMNYLIQRVVQGIGDYGNAIGIPTVGGETNFHKGYNGNILVNAMTVGVTERLFSSTASGVGHPVVYVGAKTGRDGIHGASMASSAFGDSTSHQRPTVQVGDPFMGKLLVEGCLELMKSEAIVAIQDMGAAGLTSSAVEMASKGSVGMELSLERVPTREKDLSPRDIMLSESQERMLLILKPGYEEKARLLFEKWDLECTVIGRLIERPSLHLLWYGDTVGDIPLDPLVNVPAKERACLPPSPPASASPEEEVTASVFEVLDALMGSLALCSRRFLYEHYDSHVQGRTIEGPGGDAALVQVPGTHKALALTTDSNARYCSAFPYAGGSAVVAECWRNLVAVGATPLAFTNNLNFGSPEHPHVMGQFSDIIDGMSEAARALSFPVVSGNVSFYNETEGVSVPPTPVIGGVGLLRDFSKAVGMRVHAGQHLILLGHTDGWMGASLYRSHMLGREDGSPPPLVWAQERKHASFLRTLRERSLIGACHDVSEGGLLPCLADMLLASGVGARLLAPPLKPHLFFFGEDQGRYILGTEDPQTVESLAQESRVEALRLGEVGGAYLEIEGQGSLPIDVLRRMWDSVLPRLWKGACS